MLRSGLMIRIMRSFQWPRHVWPMTFSFMLAFLLSLVPITHYVPFLKPQWIALLWIYWVFYAYRAVSINLFYSWSLGLMLDLLSGAWMGQQGLFMLLLAFFSTFLGKRFKLYHLWEQWLIITGLFFLAALALHGIAYCLGHAGNDSYLMSVLSNSLCWPLVYALLRRYEQKISF